MGSTTTSKMSDGSISEDQILSDVRAFAQRALVRTIADTENFFESGLVTSLFAVQLIAFLEKNYSFEIADEDLDIDNFNTLTSIANFVTRKL